jgi:hypothetical protein
LEFGRRAKNKKYGTIATKQRIKGGGDKLFYFPIFAQQKRILKVRRRLSCEDL